MALRAWMNARRLTLVRRTRELRARRYELALSQGNGHTARQLLQSLRKLDTRIAQLGG